jgi:hypothetical protein
MKGALAAGAFETGFAFEPEVDSFAALEFWEEGCPMAGV